MYEAIEQARRVALDLLDPTPSEVEHGMELHANSLVFDSYGFAPRAAPDGDAIRAAIEAGASDSELQDMQEDMGMTRYVTDRPEREEFEAAWSAAGVTCIFQNAGEEGQSLKRMIKRLARFTYATDMMPEFWCKAARPDDIVNAKQEGTRALYFSANGVPLDEQWISVEEELRYIQIMFQLGTRMMHLTYNRRNMIGDGCAEPANAGLSDFGRSVIAEMNRVGVIVDCAHSGWQTSLEAARVSEKPMVASHSVCCGLNEHIRGKPDKVIGAICDTGGYIGICAIPGFLGGSGDINAVLDHIDYAAKKFGVEHVAIGTDTAHRSSAYDQEAEKIPRQGAKRTAWRYFWPADDPMFDPKWKEESKKLSLAWTNWPAFTIGLVQRGYCDEDIQKIIGGNVMRVARAALADTGDWKPGS